MFIYFCRYENTYLNFNIELDHTVKYPNDDLHVLFCMKTSQSLNMKTMLENITIRSVTYLDIWWITDFSWRISGLVYRYMELEDRHRNFNVMYRMKYFRADAAHIQGMMAPDCFALVGIYRFYSLNVQTIITVATAEFGIKM